MRWSGVRSWVGVGAVTRPGRVMVAKPPHLPRPYFLPQKGRLCQGIEAPRISKSANCILMSNALRIFSRPGAFIFRICWSRKFAMTKSCFEFGSGLKNQFVSDYSQPHVYVSENNPDVGVIYWVYAGRLGVWILISGLRLCSPGGGGRATCRPFQIILNSAKPSTPCFLTPPESSRKR